MSRPPAPNRDSGSMAPASVYVIVSRSGLTCRPCSTTSSPVFTIAVISAAGTTSTMPRSIRAAPTPPANAASTGAGYCARPPSPEHARGGTPRDHGRCDRRALLAAVPQLLDAEDVAFDELEHAFEDGDREHFVADLKRGPTRSTENLPIFSALASPPSPAGRGEVAPLHHRGLSGTLARVDRARVEDLLARAVSEQVQGLPRLA